MVSFGPEFIVLLATCNNLDVLLLEINKGPSLAYINDTDYNLKYNLISDIFSLVGLTKKKSENLFLQIK